MHFITCVCCVLVQVCWCMRTANLTNPPINNTPAWYARICALWDGTRAGVEACCACISLAVRCALPRRPQAYDAWPQDSEWTAATQACREREGQWAGSLSWLQNRPAAHAFLLAMLLLQLPVWTWTVGAMAAGIQAGQAGRRYALYCHYFIMPATDLLKKYKKNSY